MVTPIFFALSIASPQHWFHVHLFMFSSTRFRLRHNNWLFWWIRCFQIWWGCHLPTFHYHKQLRCKMIRFCSLSLMSQSEFWLIAVFLHHHIHGTTFWLRVNPSRMWNVLQWCKGSDGQMMMKKH
jgi:hypothetical protein